MLSGKLDMRMTAGIGMEMEDIGKRDSVNLTSLTGASFLSVTLATTTSIIMFSAL